MNCRQCDFVSLPAISDWWNRERIQYEVENHAYCSFQLPPMYVSDRDYREYSVEKDRVYLAEGQCDLGRPMLSDDPRHQLIAIVLGTSNAPRK